jgi:hypothetical protein
MNNSPGIIALFRSSARLRRLEAPACALPFSLFLLFLQEKNSGEAHDPRRIPGFPMPQPPK